MIIVVEYFCDQGKWVVFFIDFMICYVCVLWDVVLVLGECLVCWGYFVFVFDNLFCLLECFGVISEGSIIVFYMVLLESEEEVDLMVDEICFIFDGYLYLSRKLVG